MLGRERLGHSTFAAGDRPTDEQHPRCAHALFIVRAMCCLHSFGGISGFVGGALGGFRGIWGRLTLMDLNRIRALGGRVVLVVGLVASVLAAPAAYAAPGEPGEGGTGGGGQPICVPDP